MSTPFAATPASNRRIGRSIVAVIVAILANAILSLIFDQLFHVLGVYPPWGQPMFSPALNVLALGYRIVFGVFAGYLVARLAPSDPARHARILGVIATVLGAGGVLVGITHRELGPIWYPVLLAVSAYPAIGLGAAWYRRAR
ncbi:MAG: hypothetical protein ABJE10_06045 [bacterium]